MDYYTSEVSSPKIKVVKEKHCVRRIRFSTTMETTLEDNDSIKVYCRIKPLDTIENSFLKYNSSGITYQETDKRGAIKDMKFSFHKVFNPSVDQSSLFEKTLCREVDQLIKGNNRLVFAYGTTGSGKTYTILGNSLEPGLLPRCTWKLFTDLDELIVETRLCPDQGSDVRLLSEEQYEYMLNLKEYIYHSLKESASKPNAEGFSFNENELLNLVDKLSNEIKSETNSDLQNDVKYAIWISYLEVYNDNIYDLLDFSNGGPLKIGYDSKKNNYVKDLNHINVKTWVELWTLFVYGRNKLHTNKTQLNNRSSRSHSCFTIKLLKLNNSVSKTSFSSLSICDLAGIERQKKAQNEGEKLKESRYINTSLMVLNRCFSAVRENMVNPGNKKIPPFRDSKITLIFQKAFCYGEHIRMFVNLCQSNQLSDESKTILKMSAVAQETVKQIVHQRMFLKPQSRFSIMCANPKASFFSSTGNCTSGIVTLSSTSSFISNDEVIQKYEAKIKVLEEVNQQKNLEIEAIKTFQDKIKMLELENQKRNEEIQLLNEMLEDARSEYLHLESKLNECQNNLEDAEMENQELEDDISDYKIWTDAKIHALQEFESKYERANEEKNILKNEVNVLKNENELLRGKIEKFKSESNIEFPDVTELSSELENITLTKTTKKKRALLSKMDYLRMSMNKSPDPRAGSSVDQSGMSNEEFAVPFEMIGVTRTPRSTKKGKKIGDKEFEELSGRSLRKTPRSVKSKNPD